MHTSKKIGVAQIGSKHGHAISVLSTIINNPRVNFIGLYEPDLNRRNELKKFNNFPFNKINFIEEEERIYHDDVFAIASEGSNIESLEHTYYALKNGKHVFYDKPAGEDLKLFTKAIDVAKKNNLHLQLGYMFRYHQGFKKITELIKDGKIGNIFSIRAHMSTSIKSEMMKQISPHKGGIFYDLAGHMIDQIVYMLGEPKKITSFIRKDFSEIDNFNDNTISIFEYKNCIVSIDISSNEKPPMARRFEVYGTEGSLIMEPFEPAQTIRINIPKEKNYEQYVSIGDYKNSFINNETARYVEGFDHFLDVIENKSKPIRTLDHELLTQKTLLNSSLML